MSKPKKQLRPQLNPQNSPIGPNKAQNDPKKQKIKNSKKKNYKMKAIRIYDQTPKQFPAVRNEYSNIQIFSAEYLIFEYVF